MSNHDISGLPPGWPFDWPRDGLVIISVWNGEAKVARWRSRGERFFLEPAKNAEELAAQAEVAVYAQGGALNWSGHYDCPEELAAKAVW